MVLRLALQNLIVEGVKNEVIIGSRSREAANEAAKQALSKLENLIIKDRSYINSRTYFIDIANWNSKLEAFSN